MEPEDQPGKPVTAYAVVALTILAPALGGSTELWAQATLVTGSGLLILIWPPEKSLGLVPNCLFAALLAISVVGFLPASWFPTPQWRSQLLSLGVQLPSTHSPQPWITLQWVCFLFWVLIWSYYLVGFSWRRHLRRQAVIIYSSAILCLSVVLIFAFLTKQRIPFWPEVEQFGFFPNRNQTSNVLGLGGVLIYALGLQSLLEGRRFWWLWPVSLCIVCWALILNYSRAGIILFFVGALAVHLFWWQTARDRQRSHVAVGGLALLLVLFLINGGATLSRFGHETAALLSKSGNLRWLIYSDAFHLFIQSPFTGVGLGNFRSIFAFNRFHSALESEVAHPESDWIWSALDLGLIAPVLVLILLAWWTRKSLPFDSGSVRLLRMAALVAGSLFAIHGLFDVSAHRIGALWPALFLASIGIHPRANFKKSNWVAPSFRAAGLVLILIGLWWMSSFLGGTVLPTTTDAENVKAEITSAIDREDYAAVSPLAVTGLEVAPLDWMFYYKRGLAEVALGNPHQLAVRDFTIANFLNPLWPNLYLDEAQVWLAGGDTDSAFDVLAEGMQKTGDKNGNFYSRALNIAQPSAELRDRVRELADNNHVFLTLFLQTATSFEFEIEIERILSDASLLSSFSPDELQTIFSSWYTKGDKLELAENLRSHPDWLKIGWKQLARVYADYHDYRQAYETVLQFDPPPALPATSSDDSLDKLAAHFQINPADIQNGLALYRAQLKQGQNDSAIVTLDKLRAVEGAPKYLSYFEAQLWAQAGQWQKAWEAVARYEFADK